MDPARAWQEASYEQSPYTEKEIKPPSIDITVKIVHYKRPQAQPAFDRSPGRNSDIAAMAPYSHVGYIKAQKARKARQQAKARGKASADTYTGYIYTYT